MYRVEMYARVRRACRVEGMSPREASRVFGLDRKTVRKMLSFSVPPGYRRGKPPRRPKLGPFTGIIDRILEDDRTSHHKQRHTAKRIFDRLRDEYGFTGGYTIVKDYVRERRLRSREMFVPLVHSPGHAQADFGEAMAVIGGVARKVHFLAFDLPHSDACFVKAYPAETTEAFCDGHNAAVAFFGGVPRSILYDNTKLAVARILGDGKRQRTRVFTELQSHYLFEDRFGRPGKGNDKGKVEGLVGFIRRNFLVPVPRAESFEALNDALAGQCRRRQAARLRGHKETIGERLARDREAFLPLPPAPYDACDKRPGRVSSLSLVRSGQRLLGARGLGAAPGAALIAQAEFASREVYAACGVPLSVVTTSEGTGQREGFRRLLHSTIMPLARIVAEELSLKFETDIGLSFDGLFAADLAGRARAFQSLVNGGMDIGKAAALAGLMQAED